MSIAGTFREKGWQNICKSYMLRICMAECAECGKHFQVLISPRLCCVDVFLVFCVLIIKYLYVFRLAGIYVYTLLCLLVYISIVLYV